MSKRKLVNLDAMIERADFAAVDVTETNYHQIQTVSVRDFGASGILGNMLRKPDFQRETNHWTPLQVVDLLKCFVNGDLIPSVILWTSPIYVFVIDGGHRLSVLRAWVEDDYGDGPKSQQYFGFDLSSEEKKTAKATRELVNQEVGSFKHFEQRLSQKELSHEESRKIVALGTRALSIQWVTGNANKAEDAFFKINTVGTPLDDTEQLLLRNRKRPIAISARAVIRAGKGHRYWSSFADEKARQIENMADELHQVLFNPELKSPIKTLDLPLGGAKGMRDTLRSLIEFMLIASRNQNGQPIKIGDEAVDEDGQMTVDCLNKSLRLARRITGNDSGSLGLHPAVYFYGPTGQHSGPLFMGTVTVIAKALADNNQMFFRKFTKVRSRLETALVEHKDLISSILQKLRSGSRADSYASLLSGLIRHLDTDQNAKVNDELMLELSGLQGKLITGLIATRGTTFSDDTKSQAFIALTLKGVPKCPICEGYLDASKSVSYDHITPRRDGGKGDLGNIQVTHPYCNQSIKQ